MPPAFFIGDEYKCHLKRHRCVSDTKSGARCTRKTYYGFPWCWYHLRAVASVRMAESTIAGAGRGLFAHNPGQQALGIPVFDTGNFIMEYVGDPMTDAQIGARYPGDINAPYVVKVHGDGNGYMDAACRRSGASIANSLKTPRSNRRIHTLEQMKAIKVRTAMADGPPRDLRFNARMVTTDQGVWLQAIRRISHGEEIIVYYYPGHDPGEITPHTTKNRQ